MKVAMFLFSVSVALLTSCANMHCLNGACQTSTPCSDYNCATQGGCASSESYGPCQCLDPECSGGAGGCLDRSTCCVAFGNVGHL